MIYKYVYQSYVIFDMQQSKDILLFFIKSWKQLCVSEKCIFLIMKNISSIRPLFSDEITFLMELTDEKPTVKRKGPFHFFCGFLGLLNFFREYIVMNVRYFNSKWEFF